MRGERKRKGSNQSNRSIVPPERIGLSTSSVKSTGLGDLPIGVRVRPLCQCGEVRSHDGFGAYFGRNEVIGSFWEDMCCLRGPCAVSRSEGVFSPFKLGPDYVANLGSSSGRLGCDASSTVALVVLCYCQRFPFLTCILLYIYRAVFMRLSFQSVEEEENDDDGGALAEGTPGHVENPHSIRHCLHLQQRVTPSWNLLFVNKRECQSAFRSSGRHGGATASY